MRSPLRWSVVLALVVALLGTPSAQTPATGRVMRDKLAHSQRILEAIVVSDYGLLDRESAALLRATELPAWSVLKSPEYLRQSAAFISALHDLRDAAKARDLDAAALDYMSLTLACLQCHKHLKDTRIAGK